MADSMKVRAPAKEGTVELAPGQVWTNGAIKFIVVLDEQRPGDPEGKLNIVVLSKTGKPYVGCNASTQDVVGWMNDYTLELLGNMTDLIEGKLA